MSTSSTLAVLRRRVRRWRRILRAGLGGLQGTLAHVRVTDFRHEG